MKWLLLLLSWIPIQCAFNGIIIFFTLSASYFFNEIFPFGKIASIELYVECKNKRKHAKERFVSTNNKKTQTK